MTVYNIQCFFQEFFILWCIVDFFSFEYQFLACIVVLT